MARFLFDQRQDQKAKIALHQEAADTTVTFITEAMTAARATSPTTAGTAKAATEWAAARGKDFLEALAGSPAPVFAAPIAAIKPVSKHFRLLRLSFDISKDSPINSQRKPFDISK
jgi:hypothetical protein